MATSLASPVSLQQARAEAYRRECGYAAALAAILTLAALLVHGYHPYAEDGGVYMPEIKQLVDPTLYPHGSAFVVGHLRYSLFAPMIAVLARLTHLRVETVLFGAYLVSFWMTLFAAWLLAARCFPGREARCGAMALLAVWITLPVAGTSLMLMDPYVTARSFSTPCALLALVGALDFILHRDNRGESRDTKLRGLTLCFVSLTIAVAMHPLMGAYAVGSVLLLFTIMSPDRRIRVRGTIAIAGTALAVGAELVLSAPRENAIYRQVAMTRYYWFLGRWRWYELVGIIAPLLILALAASRRRREYAARTGLARTALAAGVMAVAVSALLARPEMQSHAVARLQPLRIFQLVYIVMILVLGAALAEFVLKREPWRWAATFSLLAAVMLAAERMTFPDSQHIEWPRESLRGESTGQNNPWEQAFFWIAAKTPKDAMFALDAHYITTPGEDAQSFRAIAERTALPDFSKDGGVVTNKPELAAAWLRGQQAQQNLSRQTDAQRILFLKPLGVTWVVLARRTATRFACEYENESLKVCRLP